MNGPGSNGIKPLFVCSARHVSIHLIVLKFDDVDLFVPILEGCHNRRTLRLKARSSICVLSNLHCVSFDFEPAPRSGHKMFVGVAQLAIQSLNIKRGVSCDFQIPLFLDLLLKIVFAINDS
jgi:hypothetical protein